MKVLVILSNIIYQSNMVAPLLDFLAYLQSVSRLRLQKVPWHVQGWRPYLPFPYLVFHLAMHCNWSLTYLIFSLIETFLLSLQQKVKYLALPADSRSFWAVCEFHWSVSCHLYFRKYISFSDWIVSPLLRGVWTERLVTMPLDTKWPTVQDGKLV